MGKSLQWSPARAAPERPPSPPTWVWRWPPLGKYPVPGLRHHPAEPGPGPGADGQGPDGFSDVIAGRCSLSDAAADHPKYPGLHLLTAPLSPQGQLEVTDDQMRQLLDQVRQEYDYCLIDAPAGLGQGFRLATGCADCVVVITTTDASALRDAQHTVMLLDKRFTTESLFLVVGRVQKKLLRALHSTIDDAMDAAGLPLLGVVPEDSDVPYALNQGIPLRDINYYAARAYENIARRITGHQVP